MTDDGVELGRAHAVEDLIDYLDVIEDLMRFRSHLREDPDEFIPISLTTHLDVIEVRVENGPKVDLGRLDLLARIDDRKYQGKRPRRDTPEPRVVDARLRLENRSDGDEQEERQFRAKESHSYHMLGRNDSN